MICILINLATIFQVVPENVDAKADFYSIQTEKRSLFKSLPGIRGLSVMNPWQMARTLFNPKVHESLHINQKQGLSDGRQEHSVIDVLIPMGPDFVKLSKFRSAGPGFQQSLVSRNPWEYLGPKFVELKEK